MGEKYGGEAKLSANHRIHIAQQAIGGSDWLMVDPWESSYVPTDINFTDVIRRLKSYLEHFVNSERPVEVFYVSGTDIAGFARVLQFMDGGVCVSRASNFNELPSVFERPEIASNSDLLFVPSDDPASDFSSSKVRQWKPLLMPKDASVPYFKWRMNSMSEDHDVSPPRRDYIVRDDGEWALRQYFPDGLTTQVEKSLATFKRGLAAAIRESFKDVELPDIPQDVDVHYFPLGEQLELAQKLVNSRPTLNLDACTNETTGSGVNFSRLFEACDSQLRPYNLIAQPGFPPIEEQIAEIAPGDYLFLDDDIASGSTLNHLIGLLPENVRVSNIKTLFNESRRLHKEFNNHEVSDIVDLRDFILGAYASGLVVTSPNGTSIARVPYMLPFVNGFTRASIPLSSMSTFSKKCWDLNKDFFNGVGEDMTLARSTPEFQELMTQLGFTTLTKLADIAVYYSNLL